MRSPDARVAAWSRVSRERGSLPYAHPGGDRLFSEVSFRVASAQHVGLVTMDRYLMVQHDGSVLALSAYDAALQALLEPDRAGRVRLGKLL